MTHTMSTSDGLVVVPHVQKQVYRYAVRNNLSTHQALNELLTVGIDHLGAWALEDNFADLKGRFMIQARSVTGRAGGSSIVYPSEIPQWVTQASMSTMDKATKWLSNKEFTPEVRDFITWKMILGETVRDASDTIWRIIRVK